MKKSFLLKLTIGLMMVFMLSGCLLVDGHNGYNRGGNSHGNDRGDSHKKEQGDSHEKERGNSHEKNRGDERH